MKIISWYCKLCGNYGIKHRVQHLIDHHKAANNNKKHSSHYKPIIDILFNETIQNKFDLPPTPKLMTYPRMDRKA